MCEAMTTFDDLPPEVRSVVMYLRATANYRKACYIACAWGVKYKVNKYNAGYQSVHKKCFLKKICRAHGLRVSGSVNQLLFRIRVHKHDVLERACNNSDRFWDPVL